MILEFFFWLSGSKLQRNMKGFLCSLLRQIMLNNSVVLEDPIRKHNSLTRKRSNADWSLREVHEILMAAIEMASRIGSICLLIDDIDEFDQDEDVRHLLEIIERIAQIPNVKYYLSSRLDAFIERRLSKYKKLRLQDLTTKDMQVCIRNALDHVFGESPSGSITGEHVDIFAQVMAGKANGVFLWMHFALDSLS